MRRRLTALLALAALACAGAVAASSAGGERTAAAHIPGIPVVARTTTSRCPIPARFRPAFTEAATETSLPLALLTAVAQVESRFQPRALSQAGAQGLFQVMPTTAAELQLDARDTSSNVLAGARYLQWLLARFGSSDLALAAYNAGPTAVAKFGGAPTLETVTYVANVDAAWHQLQGCA